MFLSQNLGHLCDVFTSEPSERVRRMADDMWCVNLRVVFFSSFGLLASNIITVIIRNSSGIIDNTQLIYLNKASGHFIVWADHFLFK